MLFQILLFSTPSLHQHFVSISDHLIPNSSTLLIKSALADKSQRSMESAGAVPNRSLGGTSFRLRSRSLNSVRLRRIFDIFDKNNDSIITVEELGQALALLGLQTDPAQLDSMVQAYIQPGNHGLTYEDFDALHRSLGDTFFGMGDEPAEVDEQQQESDLSEAFKVFDEDGDGYISARELQKVLGKLGLQEGKEMERVQMMISSVDRNNDGRVDFFEFKDMMRSVAVPSS